MKSSYLRIGIAMAFSVIIAAPMLALAPDLFAQRHHATPDTPTISNHDGQADMDMHAMHHPAADSRPTMPGQDAFAAVQEIVQILEADPKTDWSKVNLEALRQHLIDMNDVTLGAATAPTPIDGGLRVAVTGSGHTVEAIQRMVAAHAHEIEHSHLNGGSAKTEALPNGVVLTVTSDNQKEIEHIRGLGFIGIMTSGPHHQPHHLAMARGEMMP
jgi:hypothetical protein